jgi:beta-lactamase regulating signal transducer with metallopeptidase domain
MLYLLLSSALRSLLLGLAVWALIRLARLRDPRTETVIWTTVLIAALSMPLLSQHLTGPVLTIPHLPAATPESATALRALAVHRASPPSRGGVAELALMWLVQYGRTGLLGAYALGLLVCLTRLLCGLLLTLRLYRRAVLVDAAWANGRNIRASIELKSPVSVAGAILLPVDYDEWSTAKRDAVLAHEEAHIARGDFFVQLAALIHCVFFWFSPFAWWLQSKLAEIAETASDEAAILRLNDRVLYAEILVEVASSAQKTPAIIAMAKDSFIEKRVEHILSETPNQHLSLPLRMLTIVALAGIALALASAKAAVSPMMATAVRVQVVTTVAKSPVPTPSPRHALTETLTPVARSAQPLREASNIAEDRDEDVTYNPRALLDPIYAPKLRRVSASTIVHAGKTFYIRSTERPVADVAVTDRTDRQTH